VVDTTLLVALGGGAGVALMLREFVAVFATIRSGVSAKEGKRKTDIVQQRDEALERARLADGRADDEATKRRAYQEYASRLRRQLIENGLTPGDEPDVATTRA
jgi:hypothetical protein